MQRRIRLPSQKVRGGTPCCRGRTAGGTADQKRAQRGHGEAGERNGSVCRWSYRVSPHRRSSEREPHPSPGPSKRDRLQTIICHQRWRALAKQQRLYDEVIRRMEDRMTVMQRMAAERVAADKQADNDGVRVLTAKQVAVLMKECANLSPDEAATALFYMPDAKYEESSGAYELDLTAMSDRARWRLWCFVMKAALKHAPSGWHCCTRSVKQRRGSGWSVRRTWRRTRTAWHLKARHSNTRRSEPALCFTMAIQRYQGEGCKHRGNVAVSYRERVESRTAAREGVDAHSDSDSDSDSDLSSSDDECKVNEGVDWPDTKISL